jgi:transcriptional regulator with XRE-family HTH domain
MTGKDLRKKLRLHGFTQRDFASLMGVSISTMENLLKKDQIGLLYENAVETVLRRYGDV